MVEIVVYVGILPVLVIFGLTTNFINMAVFARQGLSDRIHLCLFSLVVSDTGFLLFLMCGKSYAVIRLIDPMAGNYWLQRHNGPVLGNYLAFLVISNFCTSLIAVERCRCILNPLKAGKFLGTKYMGFMIAVVAVFVLVVENMAFGQKYLTVQVTDPLTNVTIFISRLSPFYLRHRTLIDIFDMYILSITFSFISFIVVIVCATAIIFRLKVITDWRRKTVSDMTTAEKQEVAITRMLVTVCCVYIVCMIPSMTRTFLLFGRLPGFLISGYLCNLFKASVAFTHLLEALNASINFLIYFKQSSRYRSTLRQLCNCVAKN